MKICAYGMDGLITPMVKRFAAEGCLPNFERMLREGTVNQTLPSFPVWTPTNWATLSTGAHTGTHGATRWRVQLPSGDRVSSFDGRALSAERIWIALERAGLKSVAVHYPAAAPSGVESGFVVDGYGHPGYASTEYEIAGCQSYTTAEVQGTSIEMGHDGTAARQTQYAVESIPHLSQAEGWSGLPESHSLPLTSTIQIHARIGDDVTTFHLLAVDTAGQGYDRLLICRRQDGGSAIARVGLGAWSEWAVEEFRIDGGKQRASVRFKLMELTPDGAHLKLYRSQATYIDGYTLPEDLRNQYFWP